MEGGNGGELTIPLSNAAVVARPPFSPLFPGIALSPDKKKFARLLKACADGRMDADGRTSARCAARRGIIVRENEN